VSPANADRARGFLRPALFLKEQADVVLVHSQRLSRAAWEHPKEADKVSDLEVAFPVADDNPSEAPKANHREQWSQRGDNVGVWPRGNGFWAMRSSEVPLGPSRRNVNREHPVIRRSSARPWC